MHTLSLLALATATLVSASLDNTKLAALLTTQSVVFDEGEYTITNVATKQSLHYLQSGQQMWPDDGEGHPITFNQHPELPYTRLSAGEGNIKCLSAQWGYDEGGKGIGADHAGVLYACAVGQDAIQSTLEKTKQWWLFVPVDNSTLTNSFSTDAILNSVGGTVGGAVAPNEYGCRKAQGWIQRHPQYVKGPNYNHTECASLLRKDQLKRLGISPSQFDSFKIAKRAASDDSTFNGGVFNIITFDHLLDMETRALTSDTKVIEGSKATDLVPWDSSDPNQQWVIAASD